MKKIHLLIAGIAALVATSNAWAQTTCPQARVQQVFTTEDKVYIQLEGQAMQVLGETVNDETSMKLNMALRARQSSQLVELTMNGNIDDACRSADTTIYVNTLTLIY